MASKAKRRGATRLLAACAVLFGLFLMHGTPASAAQGCHGAMPAISAMSAPMADAPHLPVTAAPMADAAHSPATAGHRTADAPGMPGAVCVATPAHERLHLPAPALLAVALIALGAWAAPPARRRGPPPASGRPLLLQVCIART
ncbi:hypothetical protein NMG29_22850 [Streptomyces cocklensis]|uniref:hypothetical protein n=1 Tax=Actinacidiphila cocklensis TaxID=887465 RepID=UPI00204233A2|nr:hypothetical protein [Actinacidiphila cocklensis]MDD1061023.1 hypothetical protein [Actinacidiphila cocklensis]